MGMGQLSPISPPGITEWVLVQKKKRPRATDLTDDGSLGLQGLFNWACADAVPQLQACLAGWAFSRF